MFFLSLNIVTESIAKSDDFLLYLNNFLNLFTNIKDISEKVASISTLRKNSTKVLSADCKAGVKFLKSNSKSKG